MKVVALRARAKCQVCESKLPPRTEAFWEEETRTAVCLTCARDTGIKETAPPPEAPAAAAPEPTSTAPAPEVLPEPLPEPLSEPVRDPGWSSVDTPLTFKPPSPEPTPPLRPPLAAPVGTRPPLQTTRERRPPLADVGDDPRPPLGVESQPPLPPREPVGPVLPRRSPAGGPAPLDAATAATPAPDERRPAPAADAEPDVDDEPQWDDPSAPAVSSAPPEDHSRHVRASAGLIGRLRNVAKGQEAGALVDGDVLVGDLPTHDGVERGDPGGSVVGQALETARSTGIEVLHHLAVGPGERIDQLVIAVNGLWVIRSEDALTGPLERRDLGDWFTADPRLFVGDTDRSDLVNDARDRAGTLRRFLASTSYADIPVRPVVTFGDVPSGWVEDPFSLAGVSVIWGAGLVEPMLDPVMVDDVARAQLVRLLVDAARLH
ncbi:MAG: hypothetical protein ABI239_00675 [Aquihabitans sp.]